MIYLKADNIKSMHAFSTRCGGVSAPEHTKGLNLAFGRGDSNDTVLKNLEIFADAVGFDPKAVISLPQIHSSEIYKVDASDAGQGYYIRESLREGDGYITCSRGVVLGVKSADCVPILFEATRGDEVVCIGAVHAGWRGSIMGIAPKCVRMMCEAAGVSPSQINAAIGPCIHSCCFEVGDDFKEEFIRVLGQGMAQRHILPSPDKNGKYFCDLIGLNKELLCSAGMVGGSISVIDRCTCCEPQVFFSHRYSGGRRGTMLSVIGM